MSSNWPSEQDALRASLGPGKDCPPIEDLERWTSEQPVASNVARHLQSCSFCQTELQMLHAFQAAEAGQTSKEVEQVKELLQARAKKIVRQPGLIQAPAPWWKAAFTMRHMARASFAL